MTIDPDNFEAQGMPTMAQVRTVWDAHPKPSSRVIAAAMKGKGWDISYKTVSRWKKANWIEPQRDEPLVAGEKQNHREVNKALKAEIEKSKRPELVVDNTKSAEGGIEAALTGTTMTDADLARIEAAKKELQPKSVSELREELEKERLIYNIILLREAGRKANIQVLIPKDTSTFVAAFTDDAKAAGPGLAPIQPPGVPLPIGGGTTPAIDGEFTVVSPSRAAIQRFLVKEDAR